MTEEREKESLEYAQKISKLFPIGCHIPAVIKAHIRSVVGLIVACYPDYRISYRTNFIKESIKMFDEIEERAKKVDLETP